MSSLHMSSLCIATVDQTEMWDPGSVQYAAAQEQKSATKEGQAETTEHCGDDDDEP